ncbi:MAG: DUF58 domain-containing protein [Burkholderiales bacterium]|nr:DUF58 domain-containing protein [Burkholderiales bacterium]
MAQPALTPLPSEPELRAFAHAAAQLLVDRAQRLPGARAVARRAGVGIEHFDHRDYAPGDEVRHIDWRQTARRLHPVVRRFESETVADWTLLVDASSSMALAGKWPAAAALAAALAYALLQLGHRVGLVVYGERRIAEVPAGRGRTHYAAVARTLAGLRPAPRGVVGAPGACARQLRGAVVLISDFLAADAAHRDLAALLERCTALHLLQLGAAAETRLAADAEAAGEVELVDVETGARLAVRGGAAATAAATQERAALALRLRAWCARSGVAHSDWDLARPWQAMLLAHLVRARSLRR